MSRQRQQCAGELHTARWPCTERDAVHETELRDALRISDCCRLGNAPTEIVSDNAREVDPKVVEDCDQPIRVRLDVYATRRRRVAASIAEHVEHDDTVSR